MQKSNSLPFSRFLVLALVVGIVGFAVVATVQAAPVSITTKVVNVAPSVGTPSDGGSSASTPTNVGSAVTFTTTATDANHDHYWLAVCKTGGTITPSGTGAAPTCTAGNWCISSSTAASGNANSCTYTALQADSMANNWEAYTCDNSTPSLCSAAYSGTDPNGSPFHVNHPPVIGTVAIGPSYGSSASVDPGNGSTGAVYFRVSVTDPDTEGTADTVDMYVCTNATTSFSPSTGACTGGAVLCSTTGVASGSNADCNVSNLAPVPTAHGSNNVKIYLRDSSSTRLPDNGSSNSQSYSVTDVAPTASGFSIGQNPLIPSAGSSVNQTYTATLTDNNGYTDITLASGAIYVAPATLTGTGVCTTASEINCYNASSCALSGGSGATVTATCGGAGNLITTWFNISPSASWKAHLNAVSDLGTTSMATEGTFTVNALNAIGVAEASVPYSSLTPGGASSSQVTTLQNAGNIITDVLISGTDMTSGGNTIPRSQQHWAPVTGFTWGVSDYSLLQTASIGGAAAGCSDRTIAVTTDHSVYTTSQIFWKIKIPSAQATGTYSGTNYFSATPNDCSGGI